MFPIERKITGTTLYIKGDVKFEKKKRPVRPKGRTHIQQHMCYAKPYRRSDIFPYTIWHSCLLLCYQQSDYARFCRIRQLQTPYRNRGI